jgi:hypothetical protein
VLGRVAEIGTQKHLHSLKFVEAFLYKSDLVYAVLFEDNIGNRDLHPCEDEVDGPLEWISSKTDANSTLKRASTVSFVLNRICKTAG